MIILPIQGAEKAVELYPKKLNVISVSRDQSVDPSLCKNHIQIPIDDLDDVHVGDPGLEKYTFPEKEHIQKAIDFAKQHKVHIIHCGAGISRSPAIAYAIFRSQGKSKENALSEVLKLNPHAEPNKRIVKLTDELFS